MSKLRKLVNIDTGEVADVAFLEEGDIIISEKQREAYKKVFQDREDRTEFIKCFIENTKRLIDLTLTQCGYLVHILTMMTMNNNGYIIEKVKGKDVYLNQKQICERLGIKSKQAQSDLFKALTVTRTIVEAGQEIEVPAIIIKEGQKIRVSEEYAAMGQSAEMLFRKLSKRRTKNILNELKPREIGLIYKILPYVNRYYGILCENAEEKDEQKIKYLSQEELAKLIQVDSKTLSSSMKALDRVGAAMVVRASKVDNFYIHPDFVSGMRPSYLETLLKIFSINEARRKYEKQKAAKK